MRRILGSFIVLAVVLTAAVAISHGGTRPAPSLTRPTLRIASSSSLREALDQIAASFEASTGIDVQIDYGASGALEKRLEGGIAKADVFISASPTQIHSLSARKLANSTEMVVVAGTRLALFVPAANPKQIALPKDLRRAGAIAIGNPDISVDGTSSREWLRYIGLWPELESRMVLAGDSPETERLVTSGTADAGIAFVHELRFNQAVSVVYMVPDDQINDVHYVAVPMSGTSDRLVARRFVDYLTEERAQAILAQSGLIPR